MIVHLRTLIVLATLIAGGQVVQAAQPAATLPTTAPVDAAAAVSRQVIEQTIPPILNLLLDRSLPPETRAQSLQDILRQRIDFPTLCRIMLGQPWESVPQAQRDDFINVFNDYLVSVYEPLMNEYSGQTVRVWQQYPIGRADQMVIIRVTDIKGAGERQVALIACRMRQYGDGWKAVDVTVEGISVARVFGAQFRPVLSSKGFGGLLERVRQKAQTGK